MLSIMYAQAQKAVMLAAVLAKSAQSTVSRMDSAMRQLSVRVSDLGSMGTLLGHSRSLAKDPTHQIPTLMPSASEGRRQDIQLETMKRSRSAKLRSSMSLSKTSNKQEMQS